MAEVARSHSDLDIERHNAMQSPCPDIGIRAPEFREPSDTDAQMHEYELWADYTNLHIAAQHAIIEIQTAQDQLQSMKGDIYDLMILDRRLSVIRTLLEGVTT